MRVLVIQLSNLGDAILTYPALGALWRAYPDAEVHLLGGPRTVELFEAEPKIHRVWRWERRAPLWKQLRLIARLSLAGFNLVVDFRHSAIPLFLPGARRTRIVRRSSVNGIHRARQHLSLLADLGIPVHEGPSPLPFGPEEERFVREQLGPDRPVVVMAPGSRSHLKRWPTARFAAVADQLVERKNARIVFVGDQQEQPIADAVRAAMKSSAKDLSGRTTIRQLAALLTKSDLVITNDSACLHAAEAMGAPVVAIFGPTDEKKYGPRNPRSAAVRLPLICAPCERALCPYNHECMNWLGVDEVYSIAKKVLEDNKTVRPEPFGSAVHPELVEGERPAQDRLVEGRTEQEK